MQQQMGTENPALAVLVQRMRGAGFNDAEIQAEIQKLRPGPKPPGPGALQRPPAASPLETPIVTPGMGPRDGSIPQQAMPSDPMAGTFGDSGMMPPGGRGGPPPGGMDGILQSILKGAQPGPAPTQPHPGSTVNPWIPPAPGQQQQQPANPPQPPPVPPVPPEAHPSGFGAAAFGGQPSTGPNGEQLPTPDLQPPPAGDNSNLWRGLLDFGLGTMAAGAQPGATGLGAMGAGGLAALQGSDRRKRLDKKDSEITNIVTDSQGKVWGVDKSGKKTDLGITASVTSTEAKDMEAGRKLATTTSINEYGQEVTVTDRNYFNQLMIRMGHPHLAIREGTGGGGGQQYKEGATANGPAGPITLTGGIWVNERGEPVG